MSDERADRNYAADFEVHLIRAARELLGAARTMIDGLDGVLEAMEHRAAAGNRPQAAVQAIPIRRTTAT